MLGTNAETWMFLDNLQLNDPMLCFPFASYRIFCHFWINCPHVTFELIVPPCWMNPNLRNWSWRPHVRFNQLSVRCSCKSWSFTGNPVPASAFNTWFRINILVFVISILDLLLSLTFLFLLCRVKWSLSEREVFRIGIRYFQSTIATMAQWPCCGRAASKPETCVWVGLRKGVCVFLTRDNGLFQDKLIKKIRG